MVKYIDTDSFNWIAGLEIISKRHNIVIAVPIPIRRMRRVQRKINAGRQNENANKSRLRINGDKIRSK